jgi:hypothetical protein
MESIHTGTTAAEIPRWARLERRLLATLSDAVEPTVEAYYNADGTLKWPAEGGGIDDAYEGFANLPLVYVLGGDEAALDLAVDHWEHVTEHFDRDGPGHSHVSTYEEYFELLDWMHMGEGNQLFYAICLADPGSDSFQDRARRFADLYLPEGPNYDPEHDIVVSPNTGSGGPGQRLNPEAGTDSPGWGYVDWMDQYHLPFTDVDGVDHPRDLKDPAASKRMAAVLEERWRGDAAVNLAATSLVANAYLLSGEEEYREWVDEYVAAWQERTERNDGIVPDNVGPSGEVGELFDGKWYGNYYGWTWPHGWPYVGEPTVTACENATLLHPGDEPRFDMARSTMDALGDAGIRREETLCVPYKHGDDGTFDYDPLRSGRVLKDESGHVLWREGWFEFQPMGAHYPAHVWQATGAESDFDRLRRLRDRRGEDWTTISGGGKNAAGNTGAWIGYLAGEFPEFPERILQHCLGHVTDKLDLARSRGPDYVPEGDEFLNRDSPFDVEGLIQCTMGGPMPLYNGGLLRTRVRHFDPVARRPGLPEDVAVLVTDVEDDRTRLELYNLGTSEREIAIQAGTYGEHEFGEISYTPPNDGVRGDRVTTVDDSAVRFAIDPRSRSTVELETRRFVDDPSYAPPWSD